MRHIGVDLHETNFVACFVEADHTRHLETHPPTGDGLARFVAQLDASDELAAEATQNVHYPYDQVKAHARRVSRLLTPTASAASPGRRRRPTRRTRGRWPAS